jgi:hypothetical protein
MALKPRPGGEQQQREEVSGGTIKMLKSTVGAASHFEWYLDLKYGRRVRRQSHLNEQSCEGVTLSELQRAHIFISPVHEREAL